MTIPINRRTDIFPEQLTTDGIAEQYHSFVTTYSPRRHTDEPHGKWGESHSRAKYCLAYEPVAVTCPRPALELGRFRYRCESTA